MRKISKRLLALFLVLASLITLIVPAFSVTFTHSNISSENKGNTGGHEK